MTAVTPNATNSELPAGNTPKPPSLFGRLFFPLGFIVLAAWGAILAFGDPVTKPEFDPTAEFDLSHGVIFGDLGLFTLNKGVFYLALAVIGCILFAVYVNRAVAKRKRQQTRTQSAIEGIYEFAFDNIASSLPEGKLFNRYMPFVSSVFVFIWILNMISFVPLPLNTHHTIGGTDWLYSFGIYAVTSNIFCTITIALMTFGIYHYEGVKAHGFLGYLKTWSAGQSGPVLFLVYPVEILTNLVLKPVSLAVRLFANMLSGHILILLMMALAGIVGGAVAVSVFAQSMGTIVALIFYLFEMGLVASLQAYIFAVLSAIYISSAAEEHH